MFHKGSYLLIDVSFYLYQALQYPKVQKALDGFISFIEEI